MWIRHKLIFKWTGENIMPYCMSSNNHFPVVVRTQMQNLAYRQRLLLNPPSAEILYSDVRWLAECMPFWIPKRAVSECKTTRFATSFVNDCFSMIYKKHSITLFAVIIVIIACNSLLFQYYKYTYTTILANHQNYEPL